MKIAFIRTEYDPFGGAERFTQSLMDDLTQNGIEVHIFARKWKSDLRGNVHLHRIGGINSPSLLRQASFVLLVNRALRKEHFDLIQSNERTLFQHIYRAGDGVHARWLELRAAHQGILKRLSVAVNPFHLLILWLERRLFEHPELRAVIVNSNMVRAEILSRFRIAESKIVTIYNGVDLNRFHPEHRGTLGKQLREEHGVSPDIHLALFLGSGFERKGLGQVIQALAGTGPDTRLWVVGKGDGRRYLGIAQKLGVASRVKFFGGQHNVERFYAAADFFVFPTLYDPFPSVVLEAMASGLPVITTAQCGAAEIIEHGKDGFVLADPDESDRLAAYMNELSVVKKRSVMSGLARRKAENFPWQRTVDAMLHLYRQLSPSTPTRTGQALTLPRQGRGN